MPKTDFLIYGLFACIHDLFAWNKKSDNFANLQGEEYYFCAFNQDTTENVFFNVTNEPKGIDITEYRLNR